MKKTVIFIMGSGHCGSTLLDLILGSHSDAFSLGEFQRLRSMLASRTEEQTICGVCTSGCPLWDKPANRRLLKIYFPSNSKVRSVIGRVARTVYTPYRALFRWTGKRILIDSSKQPGWIRSQMRTVVSFHGIKPILLYVGRDGRAVVNSYLRKYPERGVRAVTENWMRQIKALNAFYETFPPSLRHRLCYEELASEPETVVRRLSGFLDVDFEPDMLKYWTHDHHHLLGNGGTRSLIYKYRSRLQDESQEVRQRIINAEEHYDGKYYSELPLGIALDERWRKELSSEHVEIFNTLAGALNRPFVRSDYSSIGTGWH